MYYLKKSDLTILVIDDNSELIKQIKKLGFNYIYKNEPDLIIINKYNKMLKKMNLKEKTLIINNNIKKIKNLKLKESDVYRCGFDKYDDIYYNDGKIYFNNKKYEISKNLSKDEIINKLILINICLLCGFNCLNYDFIV